MDKVRLGNEIKKWRKLRKLTQVDLARDACNQSEISRIEKGEVFPGIDLLQVFSSKLNVPVSYFYEVLIYDDVENKNAFFKKVLKLSKSKRYEEVRNLVEIELKKNVEHPEIHKFLLWQYWTSTYILKKTDIDTCIIELSLLLERKTFGTNLYLDLHIKNSIANFYVEKTEFNKSVKLYEEILSHDINQEGFSELQIKVLYNYAKLLYIHYKEDLSLSMINRGIELSIKNNDMTFLGQLYYQKGECLERLKFPSCEIVENYKKAAFFFELLQLDYYKDIIENKKYMYIK